MQTAVQVMRSNPEATNLEIFELLIKGGIDWSMAVQLLYLLPTAYTRLILADSVAYFPETYLCNDGKGGIREWNRFDEIPLWPEVIAFAKHEISSGVKGDTLGLVAGRCAEFGAINQALHAGEAIENLVCMPPMFHVARVFSGRWTQAATFFFGRRGGTRRCPLWGAVQGESSWRLSVDRVTDGCRGGGHFGVCGSLAVANLSWQLSNCRHPSSRSLSTGATLDALPSLQGPEIAQP